MKRLVPLLALAALAACASDAGSPAAPAPLAADAIRVDLTSQFDATMAAALDRAGIGGSEFPDSLALTAEQKARIQALHAAFQQAHAADLAALKAIEAEARAAIAAKKPRDQVAAILARGAPIMARLMLAMAQLQRDVWAVYTAAQQAWITARMRAAAACPADVLSQLTEAQVQKLYSEGAR